MLLLEHLNRERFQPSLVLFEHRVDYAVPSDVPVICLQKGGWYDLPKLIWRLSRVYKRWRPDVVLSFLNYTNIIAALAQKLSHAKFNLLLSKHSLHAFASGGAKKPFSYLFAKWLPRWLYPRADKVICVSQGVADGVQVRYKVPVKKIKLIYNPVDIKRISILAQAEVDHPWFIEKRIPVLISVGSLKVQKGYPYLLNAFAQVVAEFPSRLVILGQGPEEQCLKRVTKELAIDDKVAFLGFQANPFKYMARSCLFVLASTQESFGMVITEAMACGVPVLSTCSGGPSEIITNGVNGLLVPPGDEAALTEAMSRLLRDKELTSRLAAAGKKRAADFAVEKIVTQYEALFR